jgi:hypothetical protein
MIENPELIIEDFVAAVNKHYPELALTQNQIEHEALSPPHARPNFPSRTSAVYVFSIKNDYSKIELRGRVLKVGKAGPNSRPRFQNQHYIDNSTGSTIAKSLNNNPILMDFLILDNEATENGTLNEDPGPWLKENTDRDHFFIKTENKNHSKVAALLEVYVRGRLGSILEGSATQR